ncbi:HAD family hydrolase [Spirulina sp. 06S082]|uniref:HAD family hydrolase n=1 Tax=Spirulina sp. 06S082 TaxID=3110248 RepID=UPI002B1F89D8|nr:HAD family hydrolase [Spirulina sp. 06S082]MEA5467928.1 HAD family hydrolase [Spirulina sp. 06S082]
MLKALIFDVDGTLAETERDGHRIAFNRAFAAAGLDWNWSQELYGKLLPVPGGKERICFYLNYYCSDFQEPDRLEEFIADLHYSKTQYYQDLLRRGKIPLRPGVKRLIDEARDRNFRLAIATTSSYPTTIALLEKTLDPAWFETIGAGDIVPRKKPAPDIYLYVLEKLNLEPSECVVFEDSEAGLQAATEANLKTIITANNYTKSHNFAKATLILNGLGEPDRPFLSLRGSVGDRNYVDISLLESL